MTTNAGSNISGGTAGFGLTGDTLTTDKTMKAL